MRHTSYRRLAILVLPLVLITLHGETPIGAKVDDGCTVSGAYTDRLCEGQHLVPGSYIGSANERYRLYYTGQVLLFDYADEENPVLMEDLFPYGDGISYPGSNPGKLEAFVPSNEYSGGYFGPSDMNFVVFDYEELERAHYTLLGGYDGLRSIRVDDDGCVRMYDQDGARVRWEMAGTC